MSPAPADSPWRSGNRVRLLENGHFFERVFEAISAARREVVLETFILFEDSVGKQLRQRLLDAAGRNVRVEVTVDGYGSPRFSREFLAPLAEAGVRFRFFDPHRTLFGLRLHVFRRLHRKLVVIDGERAFVGGINFSQDHLDSKDPGSKQDYTVEVEGPVVADIHDFVTAAIRGQRHAAAWRHRPGAGGQQAGASVMFDVRDNASRSSNIEWHYRRAIRAAQRDIFIANAYFFPGYGLLRELKQAARRGVRVSLMVQGETDMPLAMSAARVPYRELINAGVEIRQYCERQFHGKVAAIDDDWATVGSSNLDPLSLSLNLEANVFVRDRAFNHELRQRLQELWERQCQRVGLDRLPQRTFWRRICQPMLYHGMRRFPAWAGLLPANTPKVALVPAEDDQD